MSSKRRFDVAFSDTSNATGENSPSPLIRLERVVYDGSRTVQEFRSDLELRSGWTGFNMMVRKGMEGPMLHLSEEDSLEDAVALDEMIVVLRQQQVDTASVREHNLWQRTSSSFGSPVAKGGKFLPPESDDGSIDALLHYHRPSTSDGSSNSAPREFIRPIARPSQSSPRPLAFVGEDVPLSMPTQALSHAVVPLSHTYAVLHSLLSGAADLPRYKVVVFFPTYPCANLAAWVLRALGGIGDIYEASIHRGVMIPDDKSFQEFLNASRGVLIMNGVNNDLVGVTDIIQVGLPTSAYQFPNRVRQPMSPGPIPSLFLFGQCEEGVMRDKDKFWRAKAKPPFSLGAPYGVVASPRMMDAVVQALRRAPPALKGKLKPGLITLWNDNGIDLTTTPHAEEIQEFWRLIN